MTIDVAGPSGASVSFPDGTDPGTINSVMAQHFGGSASPAPPPDAQVAPETKPSFDTPEYADYLAKKHGVSPDYVKSLRDSQMSTEAVKGVPIAGGLTDKLGAGISALAQPLTGAGVAGGSISDRYAKNLELEKELGSDFEKAHPALATTAGVIGGTAATVPLAATAMGARALGLGGETLLGQTARGALSGAGINSADALVRGEDPLGPGAVGGAIGAVLPGAGRAVGALAQPIVNTVRGITNPADEAARRVAAAVQRDMTNGTAGLTGPEFAAARTGISPADQATMLQMEASGSTPAEIANFRDNIDRGPIQPANIMDIGGETTRALARSAANTSPEGRDLLNRTVNERFEGQSGRLTDWLRSTFHFPDADAQKAALATEAQVTNRTAYNAAHDAADAAHPGGIWSPELERLTSSPDIVDAMKAAAEKGKTRAVAEGYGGFNPGVTVDNGMVNFKKGPSGVPTYPDLRFWDYTYRNARDAADEMLRKGQNSAGSALKGVSVQLRNELDRMVPEFAQARAGAAHYFGADNALDAGANFVTSKYENNQARLALARMTPQQKQLFQDGFVDRFVKQINETGDRRSILNNIANSPAQRDRLNIALGPQRASELEAHLRVEGLMDQARGAIQGNSTTARQLTELGLAGGAGAGLSVLSGGGIGDPQSVINGALLFGAARGHAAIDSRVSRQVAQLLTSNNPAHLANGMRILARTPGLMGALRNADVALARTGSAQMNRGDENRASVH